MNKSEIPAGMREVKVRSTLPIYLMGAAWLLYALVFPLYRVWDYLLAAGVGCAVYFIARAAAGERTVLEPVPETDTGSSAANEILRAGRAELIAIGTAKAEIESAAVREKVTRLQQTGGRIMEHLEKNPGCAPSLRRFADYYLPTLKKLVAAYENMEEQGVDGENLSDSMRRIEGILDTMNGAFDRQLDALFADQALDISTDITVMEGMLAQHGLSGGNEFKRQEE